MSDLEVTFLMPCLNEEETLKICIERCLSSLDSLEVQGEVLIADNGSTDRSFEIANNFPDARVRAISVATPGYGSALTAGIESAQGRYILMADADDSYELENVGHFLEALRNGYQLVMGNRFLGGIEQGAMPLLHKYLGNPVLSFIGRTFFKIPVGDFHCGLRGFDRSAISSLHLVTPGMEFASEMVVKASKADLKITEVPTRLRKDGRNRAPHLNTWNDGWRHLVFLLMQSPRWLFIYPGTLILLMGVLGMLFTSGGETSLKNVNLDLNTFFYSMGGAILGTQLIQLGIIAQIYFGPTKKSKRAKFSISAKLISQFTLERGIVLGSISFLLGLVVVLQLISAWIDSDFQYLPQETSLRTTGLALLMIISGAQTIFSSFLATLVKSGFRPASN
jgi:glycosyltransferase involved in cell wall biosynthesis